MLNKPQKKLSRKQAKSVLRGFTLIELLVVIAIIGLLTSIILVSVTSVRAKARDNRRMAELLTLAKSLEFYYSENGQYPGSTDWIKIEENATFTAAMAPYISDIPEDPGYDPSNEYSYQYTTETTEGEEYKACATMETYEGPYCINSPLGGGIVFDGGGGESEFTCGDAIAYGGQNYATAQIGSQCWITENLNVTNGNTDKSCSITRHCHSDEPSNCDTYGGLYTWTDIMCEEASSNSEPSGVQGICPTGWHIPGHYEWVTLDRQLCTDIGNSSCDTTFPKDTTTRELRGQDTAIGEGEGSALAGNESLWIDGNLDNWGAGNNDFGTSGFNFLPAGYRTPPPDILYYPLGVAATGWSSLEDDVNDAWIHSEIRVDTRINRDTLTKTFGVSVRCLKD